jgi:hypothetical protein
VIQEISSLTQCHSYYVNALCRALWKEKGKPTLAVVQKTWFDYIDAQSAWISDDIARLSPNQRNILAGIAYGQVTEPFSQEFSERVKIGASSIRKLLQILLRDDIVYQDTQGQYHVLDPAVASYLHKIKNFDFLDS